MNRSLSEWHSRTDNGLIAAGWLGFGHVGKLICGRIDYCTSGRSVIVGSATARWQVDAW